MGLISFVLLFLQKVATTGSAPDTCCSLLDLSAVFGQVKRKAKRPGGMLEGATASGANSMASEDSNVVSSGLG